MASTTAPKLAHKGGSAGEGQHCLESWTMVSLFKLMGKCFLNFFYPDQTPVASRCSTQLIPLIQIPSSLQLHETRAKHQQGEGKEVEGGKKNKFKKSRHVLDRIVVISKLSIQPGRREEERKRRKQGDS